jgi:hypothetical protein
MRGKYSSWPKFFAAYGIREILRLRLRNAVSWQPLQQPEPGCTAIIGMCHRLPEVLLGNLRCLHAAAWPELTRAIVVVDAQRGSIPAALEAQAVEICSKFKLEFRYYTPAQAALTERLRLPYVFSWLSWSIALAECTTAQVFIQDYDALVFGDALQRRYAEFVKSRAAVQGIQWYHGAGFTAEDQLATTFEAFVDTAWIRSRHPLDIFQKIGYRDGASRDYDTLLYLQHVRTPVERRTIAAMAPADLVHPSQMIHQFTMFRRFPGKALPCFSIPMIPFFGFLSGKTSALADAIGRLDERTGQVVNFFGDGTRANFALLERPQVDWALKQMVQACLRLEIQPFADLYRYGERLYAVAGVESDAVWLGDFTEAQRSWIERSRAHVADASARGPQVLARPALA